MEQLTGRDTRLRTGPVDIDHLSEPYEYYFDYPHGKNQDTNPVVIQLPGQPLHTAKGFPFTGVKRYLWTREGANDYVEWYALFERTDGLFGFFIAECDYTGFGCEDGHTLYVGTYEGIILHAMDDATYKFYIDQTTPLE